MTEYVTSTSHDRVAYDRRGEGPAVIFIAGAGPFRAIDPWTTETAERIAELGGTSIVFDRLGRGESPAEGVLDLERELSAIDALIDLVGGSAVLCGHSSGCSIALAAAAANPSVRGLVLWEAPLAESADGTRSWIAEFETALDAEDLAGATEIYMRDMPPEWLAGVKASPEWEHIAAGAVSQRADGHSLVWATAALESGVLTDLAIPVLALYGTTTFPEMPIAAERIAAAVPHGVAREQAGADHSWEPLPMADTIVEYVRALD